ncbi:hypothetical protein GCM10027419_28330 [Pandoraea terrae]
MRAQGLRTRHAIVRVARKLLLEGGPLEFSQRAVALGAGISISNLQYYFPTRLAVLRAVIEPVIDAYLGDLRRALDNSVSPRETLDALMERGLRDANDAESAALWAHFVSFASTDPGCSRLLDEWYDTLTRELAQLVRAANPECHEADSLHVATLLIALVDGGLALQLGAGRHKRTYMQGFDARFRATAKYLVWGKLLDVGGT